MQRFSLCFPLFLVSLFALSNLSTTSLAALSPPQKKIEKPAPSAPTTPIARTKQTNPASTPTATVKNQPQAGRPQHRPQQTIVRPSLVKVANTRTTSAPTKAAQRPEKNLLAQKPAAQSAKKQARASIPAKTPSPALTLSSAVAIHKKKPRGTSASSPSRAINVNLTEIEQQISSRSAIVIDAETGDEIFAKHPDSPRQPASTIKIVTAMIALKSLKSDEIVNVSARAADMPSSKIFLNPGKPYLANDLINAVLLASANDASVALAEKISGSEESFANLMTFSARIWGAHNTVCRTASGLTADGQQSTVRDLANLFRRAMQDDDFASRMHEKFISTTYGKVLRNHNKALWRLDGTDGGKTGYTLAARQTYVGQFTRDSHTIVVAIMGSESMWADLEKLVNYGFQKKKATDSAQIETNSKERITAQVNARES